MQNHIMLKDSTAISVKTQNLSFSNLLKQLVTGAFNQIGVNSEFVVEYFDSPLWD